METKIIELEKITASNGMILTNGEAYGKEIFLGVNDSADNWYEISEEEYAKIIEEPEELATAEDYEMALAKLGVE